MVNKWLEFLPGVTGGLHKLVTVEMRSVFFNHSHKMTQVTKFATFFRRIFADLF